ncbi:MerR family transcriptional regulator [Nocardia gipuzkoensis]|uniref:helix-turn-helix domain-containing protein n=1 Tax=Nocardia gipuzkoensis TaxID=2749991 RepID=UPI003F6966A7
MTRTIPPTAWAGPQKSSAPPPPSCAASTLLTPQRSPGGHRRYSRYQLRIAARARALVDSGTPLEAACRIIVLEDQLTEALELNAQLSRQDPPAPDPGS